MARLVDWPADPVVDVGRLLEEVALVGSLIDDVPAFDESAEDLLSMGFWSFCPLAETVTASGVYVTVLTIQVVVEATARLIVFDMTVLSDVSVMVR
jgi:hypothetical protein